MSWSLISSLQITLSIPIPAMKFAATIIALYAAAALAVGTEPDDKMDPLEDVELLDDLELFNGTSFDEFDDDFSEDAHILEKRRGCTGHRKTTDVCMGKFLGQMPSRHNWYATMSFLQRDLQSAVANMILTIELSKGRGGHCCARNKNRDGGITIRSKTQKGEDCGFCFSGYCKGNA